MSIHSLKPFYSHLMIVTFASLSAGILACSQQANSPTATTTQSGLSQLQITEPRSILQQPDFSIAEGKTLEIVQPSEDAVTVLVNSGDHATYLNGTLKAKGTLILINPRGIFLGPDAQVIARNFIGSTLTLQNEDALLQGAAPAWQTVASSMSEILPPILIKHEGQIQAPGTVELLTQSQLYISGTIISGSSEGMGGYTHLVGDHIGLFDEANLVAQGKMSPGQIKIGVDQTSQSLELVPTQRIYFGPNTKIQATSVPGSAGQIQIRANESTQAFGTVIAGNAQQGGTVELSATHQIEVLLTHIDLGSSSQAPGRLLLDPTNLEISNLNNNVSTGAPFQPTGNISRVSNVTIQNALATGNVTVQTTAGFDAKELGDITVRAQVLWNSAYGLTLQAAGSVFVRESLTDLGPGNISLYAPLAGGKITKINNVRMYSNGGDIQALADESITLGESGVGIDFGGTISTTGSGNLVLYAASATKGTLDIKSGYLSVENGLIRLGAQQHVKLFHDGYNQSGVALVATGSYTGYQIGISSFQGNVYIGSSTTGGTGVSLTTANGGIGIMAPQGEVQFLGAAYDSSKTTLTAGGAQGSFLVEAERMLAQGGSGTNNLVNITSQQDMNIWLSAPKGIGGIEITLNLLGGSGEGTSATLLSNGGQNIVVEGQSASLGGHTGLKVQGGSGERTTALIQSNAKTQHIRVQHGDLIVLGGEAPEISNALIRSDFPGEKQEIQVDDGNILISGGKNGFGAGIGEFNLAGSQTITATGNIILQGGRPCYATIQGTGTEQYITSGKNLELHTGISDGGALSGASIKGDFAKQIITVARDLILDNPGLDKVRSDVFIINFASQDPGWLQQITVGRNLLLQNLQGPSSSVVISAITTHSPLTSNILVGNTATIGKDTKITMYDISSGSADWSHGTLVVDNASPTRPGFGTGQLINQGTLELGPDGKVFAVSPASVTLGTYTPANTKFNLWYGEMGAVTGINYKALKP